MNDERPHKVNSWNNFEENIETEVWYNGKDAFNVYLNGKRIDTCYIHEVKEWGANKCSLLAVSEACKIGWERCFHAPFPGKLIKR